MVSREAKPEKSIPLFGPSVLYFQRNNFYFYQEKLLTPHYFIIRQTRKERKSLYKEYIRLATDINLRMRKKSQRSSRKGYEKRILNVIEQVMTC